MSNTEIIKALLFLATLPVSVSASAVPAWETSAKWMCRGEKVDVCELDAPCKSATSGLLFEVDFEKMIFRPFDWKASPIVGKSFVAAGFGKPGLSLFVLANGSSYSIMDIPMSTLLDRGAYGMTSSVIYGDSGTIHFGACRPKD